MILKIVEGVSSKDTFHVAKTAVDLSIFSQLPFLKNYFLKLLQKLKKPDGYVVTVKKRDDMIKKTKTNKKKKSKGGRKAIRQQYQLDGDDATSTGQSLISTSEHHQSQGDRSIRRPIWPY